jgi:D-glucosaminate-6-phosphate ammonia-lyase
MLGVKIIEVHEPSELESAFNSRTAMAYILGGPGDDCPLGTRVIAEAAKRRNVPVIVDAAAEILTVNPNVHLQRGATAVAYSGGKCIRGPQAAGLLLGEKNLLQAAWANSAPHHAFGRTSKVSKEEIVGMLRAVEIWRQERDIHADFRMWESWYLEMIPRITKAPGVRAEVHGPIRGGPFPTLGISWDSNQIGLTAGQVGRALLEGEPRIATHAEGDGHSFAIRPVAMKAGEYKIVAQRLYEVFSSAPKPSARKPANPASVDLSGTWEVEIQYEVGSARHKFTLNAKGNDVTGSHEGWAYRGGLTGTVDGSRVKLHSSHPADGNTLSYTFTGTASSQLMSGGLNLGEYGKAKWVAHKRSV